MKTPETKKYLIVDKDWAEQAHDEWMKVMDEEVDNDDNGRFMYATGAITMLKFILGFRGVDAIPVFEKCWDDGYNTGSDQNSGREDKHEFLNNLNPFEK